jgi:hypothetical protein
MAQKRISIISALLILIITVIGICTVEAKTVHVKGYRRKDGTYVAPHTRSSPGSGHSGGGNTRPVSFEEVRRFMIFQEAIRTAMIARDIQLIEEQKRAIRKQYREEKARTERDRAEDRAEKEILLRKENVVRERDFLSMLEQIKIKSKIWEETEQIITEPVAAKVEINAKELDPYIRARQTRIELLGQELTQAKSIADAKIQREKVIIAMILNDK